VKNSFSSLDLLVLRDTSGAPDIGYDPLDYVVSGRAVSANLTLTDGAALGTYGTSSSYGLGLSSGSFVSEGTPTNLNWIVRYNTVQEQSATNWAANSVGTGVSMASDTPIVNIRFTGWSLLGGTGTHFHDSTDGTTPTAFTHSQFSGGKFTISPGSVALTNCVWERVSVKLQDDDESGREWDLFNNLFYGGTLFYRARGDDPTLRAFDNLFDQTAITRAVGSDHFTHGNNGYVGGIAHLAGTSAGGDKDITSPADYQVGPLGNFYYPTTGGNLSQLMDTGSRTAGAAELDQHTTRTDQTLDSDTVDIGFHYAGWLRLAAECRPRSIALTWDATAIDYWFGISFIEGFNVYRSATHSGPYNLITTTPLAAAESAYTDIPVVSGVPYYYVVAFVYTDPVTGQPAESLFSNEASSSTCCPPPADGFWTDPGPTKEQLAHWIMGPNITVQNVNYAGVTRARGTFGNGNTVGLNSHQFPIDHGVILSSGDIVLAKGPNDEFGAGADNGHLGAIGDSDLNNVINGGTTLDAAVLEFDFTSPNSFVLLFEYIFASEEYPEWINRYNDPMAIFVTSNHDGTGWVITPADNIARVPIAGDAVSVNTVNGGCIDPSASATNPLYYVDNYDPNYSSLPPYAASAPVYNLQYDGVTVLLTAQASVSAIVTYHVKIAIADNAGITLDDSGYDSAILIKAEIPCP